MRLVDGCDVVTQLPPALSFYAHAGAVTYITCLDGDCVDDPAPPMIEADRIQGRARYAAEHAWKPGSVLLRELADHAPINYARGFSSSAGRGRHPAARRSRFRGVPLNSADRLRCRGAWRPRIGALPRNWLCQAAGCAPVGGGRPDTKCGATWGRATPVRHPAYFRSVTSSADSLHRSNTTRRRYSPCNVVSPSRRSPPPSPWPACRPRPRSPQDTIKVGVLHSLSGTMAISETVLKDTVLMAIDEINAKGGVLGKKLEPVVVDPASNWPLFAEKTKQLLGQDKVAVIFGCWTSVSRKSVLPVVEEMNGLLFYPVQYEGEELSQERVLHGCRAQPAGHSRRRLPDEQGRRRRQALGAAGHRLRLPAHHQQDPARLPEEQGREGQRTSTRSTRPFGHSDYQTIVADIKKFSAGGKTAVVSTINGDSNVPFYKELGNAGLKAKDVPVVAFSVGEEELRGVDTKPLVGHLAAWNYFMSHQEPDQHRVHQEVERLRQGQEASPATRTSR